MNTFEHALLAELRTHVAERNRPRRWRWAAVPLGAGTAVAALVVALAPSAAYAVEKEADGDIVVTIARLDDADGLKRALAAEGVTAEVRYAPVAERADGNLQTRTGQDGGLDEDGPPAGTPDLGSGCAVTGPVRTSIESGGLRLEIPGAAAHSDSVLHIETGGVSEPGPASLLVRWTC